MKSSDSALILMFLSILVWFQTDSNLMKVAATFSAVTFFVAALVRSWKEG